MSLKIFKDLLKSSMISMSIKTRSRLIPTFNFKGHFELWDDEGLDIHLSSGIKRKVMLAIHGHIP